MDYQKSLEFCSRQVNIRHHNRPVALFRKSVNDLIQNLIFLQFVNGCKLTVNGNHLLTTFNQNFRSTFDEHSNKVRTRVLNHSCLGLVLAAEGQSNLDEIFFFFLLKIAIEMTLRHKES